jgi:hypothetical protein
MKHLIWGIIATTIGSFSLLSILILAHPTLGMGIYGVIFLAYGIYRINQYRNRCKGADLETDKDSLQKWNIY